MLKKILTLIREEREQRRKDRLFKKISALRFDGYYFAWLAKQLAQDTKVTVKSTDGVVTTEYTLALIKGAVADAPSVYPIKKPGVRTAQ